MEQLSGTELFIGRESGTNKLFIYFLLNGHRKGISIGEVGSVPKSVSRALPDQNKAHISLMILDQDSFLVTNLKDENVTFVNGTPCVSKKVLETDRIELGQNHYQLPLKAILKATNSLFEKENPKPYDITHLEKVWKDYHEGDLSIKDKQLKIGLQQRIPIFFTIGAGALTSVAWSLGWGEWIRIVSICLTGIGLLLMGYFFIVSSKFNPSREADRLREDFQSKYICPNTKCKRFLGNYPYSMMKNQYKMECPYCKSKFTEN